MSKIRSKIHRLKRRNNSLFDSWSIVHLTTAVLMGWLMNPLIAILLLILWEPLEIFILSPILAKYGIEFGYETIHNSLSDIVFDTLGVIIGFYLLTGVATPPVHLF